MTTPTAPGWKKPSWKPTRTGSGMSLGRPPSDYRNRSLPVALRTAESSSGRPNPVPAQPLGRRKAFTLSTTSSGMSAGPSLATCWPSLVEIIRSLCGRTLSTANGNAFLRSKKERKKTNRPQPRLPAVSNKSRFKVKKFSDKSRFRVKKSSDKSQFRAKKFFSTNPSSKASSEDLDLKINVEISVSVSYFFIIYPCFIKGILFESNTKQSFSFSQNHGFHFT